MEYNDIQPLILAYHRVISSVDLRFKRYLYSQVNWDVRLIGIKGARGVGKTTMLLQRIKDKFDKIDEAFYVSLDSLWFNMYSLIDLVDFLYTHGVNNIFLDEVHKYPNWIQTLKNLYDNYPDLNIVYTGSSMLELDNSKADLSRRQTIYTLNGLSFREYLEYEGIYTCGNIDFHHLLENHVNYAMEISGKIKVLKFFKSYLKKGYYPYYKKIGPDYYMRINEVVRLVIESDLPSVENIAYSTVKKTEKLLMIIAKSVPFIPNINSLCGQVELTRDMCLRSLYALDKAGLLNLLTDEIKNYKQLSKPEKIYLANTDLMYALSSDVSVGNIRETFFAEQVSSKYPLALSHKGDFKVNDNYHFEVGGKKKNFDQIADMDNGYLAVDDTEIGYGHRIPLWMFGMLY